MYLSYKYRLYPNKQQAAQIEQTFGCCRYVYNQCIDARNKYYSETGKLLPTNELIKLIPTWKNSTAPWLSSAPSQALQQTVRDLDKSYRTFFKKIKKGTKAKPPRYKKKKCSHQSYRVTAQNNCVRIVDSKHVRLPKLGNVRCSVSRMYRGRIVTATVLRNASHQYFIVLLCDGIDEAIASTKIDNVTGIDVGIKNTVVCSNGATYINIKTYYKYLEKLEVEAKKLSRKVYGSKNYHKQKKKLTKVYNKIANIRHDYIHKITTAVVRDSQAIAVENLDVSSMARTNHLGAAVHDAAIGMTIRFVEYKCKLYGRQFVKVSRWFPSSKLCSKCGYKYDDLTLDVRHWRCPSCGSEHDRDFNAACNISKEGLRLLTQNGAVGHTEASSNKTPD